MALPENWRNGAKLALERYFRRQSLPRVALSLVLIITGFVGWFISYALLHAGLGQMWLRYPVAVLLGYGFFLALLRLWVEIEKRRFRPEELKIEPTTGALQHRRASDGSWLDWLDFDLSAFDADDEGCLIGVLIGAIFAAAVGCLLVVFQAPGLVAEVFLDVFLVSALHRRLRIAAREHWLGTAIRKTWSKALLFALALGLAGWVLSALAPGARSIGPAVERLRSGKPTGDVLLEDPVPGPK